MAARSTRHYRKRAGAALLWAVALSVPALAGSALDGGDGSGTDNPRLLPDVYPEAPLDPALAEDLGSWREPYDPFFDVDWSVALRGSYTKSTSGERFDVLVVPNVTLQHSGSRSRIEFDADAEIDQPINGELNVSGLRLSLDTDYALDRETTLTGAANLSLTQDPAGTPGLASTIAEAPQTVSGGVGLGVTRQFGRFNVGVTGAAERTAYGPTTLTNATVTDNSERNVWSLDAGLRVGFQATPIFEVFGEAGVGRDMFDLPSSTLLVRTDATDSSLKGGVVGRWNETLEAEASVGVNLRRFDEASLGEVVSQLYDARVSFTPDPTWRFTAALATNVAPPGPDSGGTARVEYAATGEVAYTVNSWLALRGLVDWHTASFVGSANSETGHGYGMGADYKVNAHTALSADYGYAHADTTTDGPQDSHRVSVGITLAR